MENKEIIVKKIRSEYTDEYSKLDELKDLDREVKRPAQALAYTVGAIGSLILGSGMCLAMGVIGKRKIPGIVIGCAGIATLAGNYHLYKTVLNSRKKAYADRIKELSDEILADESAMKEEGDEIHECD